MDLTYLKPMLCQPADEPPFGPTWAMEPKLDGWRFIIVREQDRVAMYGGRNASDYSGSLPYLEADLVYLPVGTILDGELTGIDFDHVGSVMRSNVAHTPVQGDPALTFMAFDMLAMGGRDMRKMKHSERRDVLNTLDGQFQHVRLTDTEIAPNTQSEADLALERAVQAGNEGLVFKRIDSTYVHTRSPMWVKCKPFQTADAKVIGIEPGKSGRWIGKAGAFRVELLANGVQTTVKCGSDEAHEEATNHPERWIGETIEFQHHGLHPSSGVPRHPTKPRRKADHAPKPHANQNARMKRDASPAPPSGRTTGSKRNYGAMHDAKLARSIEELRGEYGEAWQKVQAKAHARGMDPATMADIDLRVAEQIARSRGGLGVVA